MNVIRFPVHFQNLIFQLFGSALKRFPYLLDHHAVKNLAAVLRRKNQVDNQLADAMVVREIPHKCHTHFKNIYPALKV